MAVGIDFYLDWAQDMPLTGRGTIKSATGWDLVKQRIVRRLLTNPQFTLADGTVVSADLIFDPNYGVGLNSIVYEPMTEELVSRISRLVNLGVMDDASIDQSKLPDISVKAAINGQLIILMTVFLADKSTGNIQVIVPQTG